MTSHTETSPTRQLEGRVKDAGRVQYTSPNPQLEDEDGSDFFSYEHGASFTPRSYALLSSVASSNDSLLKSIINMSQGMLDYCTSSRATTQKLWQRWAVTSIMIGYLHMSQRRYRIIVNNVLGGKARRLAYRA